MSQHTVSPICPTVVSQHGLLPNMDALSAFIHCSTARSLPVVFMQSRPVPDTVSGPAPLSSQRLANAVAWTLELLPSAALQSARKWVCESFLNALSHHDFFLIFLTCGCVAVNFPPMQIKKHRSMLNHATTSATGGLAQIHSIFLRHVTWFLIDLIYFPLLHSHSPWVFIRLHVLMQKKCGCIQCTNPDVEPHQD
jgi:hypothetical protein